MSHVIRSTIKIYGSVPEVFFHNHLISIVKQKIMGMITVFGQFYFTSPKNSTHIRHYVDPITGRAISVKG